MPGQLLNSYLGWAVSRITNARDDSYRAVITRLQRFSFPLSLSLQQDHSSAPEMSDRDNPKPSFQLFSLDKTVLVFLPDLEPHTDEPHFMRSKREHQVAQVTIQSDGYVILRSRLETISLRDSMSSDLLRCLA